MGVILETGCKRCGMFINITPSWCNDHLSDDEKLRSELQVCEYCFFKKYSKHAIRNEKLDSLLSNNWFKKIFNL